MSERASTRGREAIAPPFGDQRFDSFDQWVAYASSWLTCHIDYNNTEHGEKKGWRGNHFTALCFDSLGRRCRIGADMHRARDEGAFPVWWIWPDQIAEMVSRAAKAAPSESSGRNRADANPDPLSEGRERS